MDGAATSSCRRGAAARAASAGSAARLRGVVDLRVRRTDLGRTARRAGERRDPRAGGAAVVPLLAPGSLRQQPASVERGAVLLRHGHPSVGQVLHGRVARPPRDDLGDRCARVPRIHCDRVHGPSRAVQLRLPVDLNSGQGRTQLGRYRRLVQRPELRPDAALPRRSPTTGTGCARGMARAAGTPPWRGAAVRRPGPGRRQKLGRPIDSSPGEVAS